MTAEHDPESRIYLAFLLLLVGVYVTGYFVDSFSDELTVAARFIAWVHVKPFALLAERLPVVQRLPVFGNWLISPALVVEPLVNPLLTGPGAGDRTEYLVVGGRAASVIHAVPGLLLLARAGRVRLDLRFRKRHNLISFISFQARAWPAAGIARHLTGREAGQEQEGAECGREMPVRMETGRLLQAGMEPGVPDAGSDSLWPESWLQLNGLAGGETRVYEDSAVMNPVRSYTDNDWRHLTSDAVNEVFEGQFTESWQGFDGLKTYERALAAAFACSHAFQPVESRKILIELARIADRNFTGLSRFDTILACHHVLMSRVARILESSQGMALGKIADGHAWKLTAFMVMLHYARLNRGVLASAEFLWLKHVDRRLWYALNCSGNAVAVAETAGIHAHYRAERQARCAIHGPAVNQATRSILELYLDLTSESVEYRRRRAFMHLTFGEKVALRANRTRLVGGKMDIC